LRRGHRVHFVSSIATNRTREALYNSWDKNDPKDAQVILHLLKGGVTQHFSDPLEDGNHDFQELLGTYRQIVDRKVRVYHALMSHYLPLYFPEAEPFIASTRSEWFLNVFLLAPIPTDVLAFTKAGFLKKTVKGDEGHPTVRRRLVAEYYETAKQSVGIPVPPGSVAMQMFRLVLEEYIHLAKVRRRLEKDIHDRLERHPDYQRPRTIPGIGPIVALTILAEGGNLRRFSHYRKFLKFCGFDLSTSQSGQRRGVPQLSKRGNAQLRCAFWMAGKAAVAQRRSSLITVCWFHFIRDKLLKTCRSPARAPPAGRAKHPTAATMEQRGIARLTPAIGKRKRAEPTNSTKSTIFDIIGARGSTMAKTMIGVREAAKRLGVHENTLRNWEERGLIRSLHLPVSGYRRFQETDIARFASEMRNSFASADEGPAIAPGRSRHILHGDHG